MKPAMKYLLLAMFLLISGTLWGQAGLYTVTGNRVNVRSGPGTNYQVVDSRIKGDTVTVLSMYDADWAQIRLGSSSAYMSRHYLAYEGPLPEQQVAPKVKEKGVWASLYRIVKVILWLCVILIVLGGLVIGYRKGLIGQLSSLIS